MKYILAVILLTAACFAQQQAPEVVFGNIPIIGPSTAAYKAPPFPAYGSGTIVASYTNVSGVGVSCIWQVLFTGSGAVPQQIQVAQATVPAPASGSSQVSYYVRSNTAIRAWPAVSIQWNCGTYPTNGNAFVEFIPDSQPQGYNYAGIVTNTSAVLSNSPALLHSIVINQPGTTETITIWDNVSCGSGTKIGTIVSPTQGQVYVYDVGTLTGLCVQTSGTTAGDYTVAWR